MGAVAPAAITTLGGAMVTTDGWSLLKLTVTADAAGEATLTGKGMD